MHRERAEGATPALFVTSFLKEVSGLQPCRVFDQILHHSPMEAVRFPITPFPAANAVA
jgi:hypothetical protein